MRDEGITVDPALSLAEQAVCYLLRRMRVDANLRWYMLHTEAFARLCSAEAARTGQSADAVMEMYSEMAPHCKADVPDVERLRRELEGATRTEEPIRAKASAPAWVDGDVPGWLNEDYL